MRVNKLPLFLFVAIIFLGSCIVQRDAKYRDTKKIASKIENELLDSLEVHPYYDGYFKYFINIEVKNGLVVRASSLKTEESNDILYQEVKSRVLQMSFNKKFSGNYSFQITINTIVFNIKVIPIVQDFFQN